MAHIRVTRKAHVRRDGTIVRASTYYVKDKGKPGRRPESARWYEHNVEMNWSKGMPAAQRRANALKAHRGDQLATARALQALANVTTDAGTAGKAKTDAAYFFAQHEAALDRSR